MFRRSSVTFAASLALLLTLDSATCFAAAAPAPPREDVDRPRFLKKEIKRFVFANTTTSSSEPANEPPTSTLDALLDTLTSSSSQDLGADATPTSVTSAITTTPSVTLSDDGLSSTSDVSVSSAGASESDREASLAPQSSTTTAPVSSVRSPSSTSNNEGATTQSSTVPGGNVDVATGSSQSLPSSSASPTDQSDANGVVPQTTQSSTAGLPENGLTSSQPGSTGQPETSVLPSSAATSQTQQNPGETVQIADRTSSSLASETSVSNLGEQGSNTLASQTPPTSGQQTDTQVQASKTQGIDTLQSSLSSEGAGPQPTTSSTAGSSSPVLPAGEKIVSSSGPETDSLTNAVTTTGSPESFPVTTAGAASSAVGPPARTTINSEENDLTSGSSTPTEGASSLPVTAAGGSSSVAVPPAGTTISSNANDETGPLTTGVAAATEGSGSLPVTTTGAGSSAVVPPAGTTVSSNANDESGPLTTGVTTATAGTPLAATSSEGSLAAGPGETIKTSANGIDTQSSLGGEATSGVSAPNTKTGDEGSGNTNTIASAGAPTTSGNGAGAITTPAAEPASSPVAPQSVAVTATGTSLGSETSHVTPGSGDTQPTVSPGVGAGPTSQDNGLPGSSASVALQSSIVPAVSQPGGSLPQTTLTDGAVVANTPQTIGAATATTAPLETPPASLSSPGADQNSSPNPNGGGTTQAASVVNPSAVAAASTLNAIPASIENSLASVPGNPSLVFNPALTSAAAALEALSISIQNPEQQTSLPGSPSSASPVVSGGSNTLGGITQNPAGTSSPVGATETSGATGSPVSESVSPISGTQSAVGVTDSTAGGTASSGEPTASQVSGQNPQNTATGTVVPGSGSTTASNGEVVSGTLASNLQSATPESGVAGYSTQSDGKVVPTSAAAGTASTLSNGQIVPATTDHEDSTQLPGPSETGAVAASSAAAVAATQSNAVPPVLTTTPAGPPTQEFTGKGPYTQSPVSYDSATTRNVPTSIIHGPSSTPSATEGHYFGPSSLPSNVPQILYQNGGPGSQPPNTRLINIAFRYPLNYLFVYNHTESQQQIFYYIPRGISFGLEIEGTQITMQSLRAWDTYEDVGYVTTLALAWIPEGLVDNLGLLVSTPVSRFYHNPDNSTNFLLSMINSAIPITSSNSTDGGTSPFGNIPSDVPSAKTNGAPIGGDIGNSEHVRASSVGIGVGVACGAAAYGAAMFFVARRYKKRRQSHTRSPSMFSSPVMSHAGPDAGAGAALMSGAMGERSASPYYDNDDRAGSRGSGRSGSSRHQISAPVMAENSLGWN